ncbi:MAG: hypothetical protein LBE01_00680 [Deltaproteobacteria bacterium]|jgi:hypothetical protein|nr:hypothetical protein [Deltaproteobacteria bacterium]
MATVFFLAGLALLSVGLLSILVGLAYAGQAGAWVALGSGVLMVLLGAGAFTLFLRRLSLSQSPK